MAISLDWFELQRATLPFWNWHCLGYLMGMYMYAKVGHTKFNRLRHMWLRQLRFTRWRSHAPAFGRCCGSAGDQQQKCIGVEVAYLSSILERVAIFPTVHQLSLRFGRLLILTLFAKKPCVNALFICIETDGIGPT